MRGLLILLIGVAGSIPIFSQPFTLADTLRGGQRPERFCYDATYYDLHVSLSPKTRTLEGYVDIYFRVVQPFERLQIDLAAGLNIDSIVYRADTLVYERLYDAVFVSFPDSLQAGDSAVFRVYYGGAPRQAPLPPWDGGLIWERTAGMPWLSVACEYQGASIWWPCKDDVSDEPDSMGIHITLPRIDSLSCVSNGRLRGVSEGDSTRTWHWFVANPINLYNITFYTGPYRHFTLPYTGITGNYELDFYVRPQNFKKARKHFQQAVDVMRFFEYTFGPYPWWEDGFKLVESSYAGMEHQSAIAYGYGYANMPGYNIDYIVLHETAHEWWGNSVTAADMAELWLHEGFATYSEALYIEHIEDYQGYLFYLMSQKLMIGHRYPIIGAPGVRFNAIRRGYNWDNDVYYKGAWVLHTLRSSIGEDSLFFDILKTFAQERAKSIVRTQDFIDLVNHKTGLDYSAFFKQYLSTTDVPVFLYTLRSEQPEGETESVWTLSYKWQNAVEGFEMPIWLEIGEERRHITPHADSLRSISLGAAADFELSTQQYLIEVKAME